MQGVPDPLSDNSAHADRYLYGQDTLLPETHGGDAVQGVVQAMRSGGRIAYPNGIFPVPDNVEGMDIRSFNGEPDKDLIERLNALIGSGPFEVHIATLFTLEQAAEAQKALEQHVVGKIVLQIG